MAQWKYQTKQITSRALYSQIMERNKDYFQDKNLKIMSLLG
jgi:hypothetical protein